MSDVKRYSLRTDRAKKLSDNFKVAEFACKDGSDAVLISSELVEVLQKIRNHFGKAITINSAYRNAAYNKKVGGASKSQHVQGTAADIVVSGVQPVEVAKYAEYLMPQKGGIGLYGSFTHIDTREKRSRWKNFGTEVVVSGFPGYVSEPELSSGEEIVQAIANKYKIEISDTKRAVKAIDKAKNSTELLSVYWMLRKLANK